MTVVDEAPSGPERASREPRLAVARRGERRSAGLLACDRDRMSAQRDRLAEVRDRLADAHDEDRARGAAPRRFNDTYQRASGREIVFRAARERAQSAGDRQAAAEQRIAAALDREHAERDRQMAAVDRGGAPEPTVIRRDLAPHAAAVAGARRSVAGLGLPVDVTGTVELAVSELVTNAITHAGLAADDVVELQLTQRGNRVRVAVHDRGHGFAVPPVDCADPSSVHGRGLTIVRELAETWGVNSGPTGCTVWCDVLASPPVTQE